MSIEVKPAAFFEATVWSTVLKARQGDEEAQAAAMERLLSRYRPPILRQIQASWRCTPEQAEDLTQDFILHCLQVDFLRRVDPGKGRFRAYIKTCISNFLADQHARDMALKRGGGERPASLDETDDFGNRLFDPASGSEGPGEVLDRAWALEILDHALECLEMECVSARQGALFEAVKGQLGRAPDEGTAAEIASNLGLKAGAVHAAMFRMRKRLGELIHSEVLQTVATEADAKDELSYLVKLL